MLGVFCEEMNGQELIICNTVVSLLLAQCSTVISNDMLGTILNLRQYCHHCVQASISVQDELALIYWKDHDVWTS